jgi:hypothetical protein
LGYAWVVKRERALGLAIAVAVSGVFGVLGALQSACSSSPTLVGAGQACLNATDCQPGLVCVPQGNGGDRVCSDDLSGIQKTETTDSGATSEAGGGKEGGAQSNDGGGQGSTDSGGNTQDNFVPPVDSGSVTDAGTNG